MDKYYKNLIVKEEDTYKDGFLRIDRMLANMAEISTLHSNALGLSLNQIRKNDYGWMLINWELEVLKYPKLGESVKLLTWTSAFNKFYANREFLILDLEGQVLVKASSLWAFLDIQKRRPLRIPKEIIEKYSLVDERNFTAFTSIQVEGEILKESEAFIVGHKDLDENMHVNNIRYIEWLLLGFSKMEETHEIKKLAIHYKKELLLNDRVKTQVVKSSLDNKFYHIISTNNKVNALMTSRWEKKKTPN